MSVAVVPAVRQTIEVDVPPERAFELFTAEMSAWWPLETHHIGDKEAEAAVVEPRAGGRWFERAADGTECDWGRVLEYEPPQRVVFAWQLNADWQFDPDPAKASEVEVTFTPTGEGSTRVELEHRRLDRMGERAEEVRQAISSEGGWTGLLRLFKEHAES
jgi:uncharacterized protein YndB with AHSA1/START domain